MSALEQARQHVEVMISNARVSRAASSGSPQPSSQMMNSGSHFNDDRSKRTAKAQYAHNTGWTYASVRPIANTIAGQPIFLAKVDGSSGKSIDPAMLNKMPRDIRLKVEQSSAKLKLIEKHPFLTAMDDPNPLMVRHSLLFMLAASLQLTARGYWWINDSDGRRSIWPLPTHWVEQIHDDGLGRGWKITPPNSTDSVFVPHENIAPFYYPDASDPFGATGPVSAAARSIITSNSILEAQEKGFENDVVPGLAVILGDTAIGPDGNTSRPQLEDWQLQQIETRLNQFGRGTNNHRKMLVLDRLIKDVKPITQTNAEMDYQSSGEMTKKAIMMIFGVNPIIAGEIEGANRASAVVAGGQFCDSVINPTTEMMTQVINKWVLPLFTQEGENLIAWIEKSEPQDKEMDLKGWEILAGYKSVTRDEMRFGIKGLPPMPNGEGQSVIMGISEIAEPVGGRKPAIEEKPDEEDDDVDEGDEDDAKMNGHKCNGKKKVLTANTELLS